MPRKGSQVGINSKPYAIDSFKALVHKYPTIYDAEFTFCVPDVWVIILENLSLEISVLLAQHPLASICVSDVKESYGSLRFYYSLTAPQQVLDTLNGQIESLIERAESQIQIMESNR